MTQVLRAFWKSTAEKLKSKKKKPKKKTPEEEIDFFPLIPSFIYTLAKELHTQWAPMKKAHSVFLAVFVVSVARWEHTAAEINVPRL